MTYFDCFVVGAWTFATGWFIGAIYMQNRNEKTAGADAVEKPESCPDCEAWRLPAVSRAVGMDALVEDEA